MSRQALLWRGTPTFLFISRHPLAVALAHRAFPGCSERELPIGDALLHWTVSHGILAADLPHLARARTLRYEDLAAAPAECAAELLRWLELPGAAAVTAAAATVKPHANRKYETTYCTALEGASNRAAARRAAHCGAALALQPRIDELGLEYDVATGGPAGFGCVRAAAPCDGLEASAALQRKLESHAPTTPPVMRGSLAGPALCWGLLGRSE